MKVRKLAGWLGILACTTACAHAQRPSAPLASAAPEAEERAGTPEGALAAPAPAPPAAAQGLDAPKSKTAKDETEFSTLEAAERALKQAEADLDRLALAQPSPVIAQNAAADRAAEKKESKPARAPSAGSAAAPSKPNAVCEDACRAFSSLSRAASAVCRLDGSAGTHCSHAKQVLADAQQRVSSCSCPAASD